MKRTFKIVSGMALIASLGIASAVYAHGDGFGPGYCAGSGQAMGPGMGAQGFGPMGGMGGAQGMPGHRAGGANFDPAAMMEGRIAYLKSALKITDQQESAWQAYSAKAKQQAETMLASRTAMHNANGTAAEQMALRTAMMQQHLANMETMNAALKDLYAVLTPEQKALADQHFGNMRMAFGEQAR